jgi:hypothetical protein
MKRPGCAALTAALFGSTSACTSAGRSDVAIVQVTPSAAFNDVPFSLTIDGFGFRPAYDVDIASGSAGIDAGGFSAFLVPASGSALPRVAATGVTWQSTSELVAMFPAGVVAGSYGVGVHDPRGQDTIRGEAFTSLGQDTAPPDVSIQQPASGALYGAGAEVDVLFVADDGAGAIASLGWTATTAEASLTGSCPVGSGVGPQICRFSFTAPPPSNGLEALLVVVSATDEARNEATAQAPLTLAPLPGVTSVTPRIGTALGGDQIDVEGSNFFPPTSADPGTQILVDNQPIPTTVTSGTHLVGISTVHDAGVVPLSVSTGHAATPAGSFTFVAPAVVRLVSPASGPTAGGTPVAVVGDNFRASGTTIWFGSTPLACPTFVSANRIEGWTPPGTGVVAVSAHDPVVNGNVLAAGFSYADDADAGPPPAGGCGGSGP